MRVIAGTAKGRRLRAPADRGVRPTKDLVKAALFSMLGDAVPDAWVLDLFAGTGALGIEALSRGAAGALFVDRDPAMARLIRHNLRACGLEDRAEVWVGDAVAACGRLGRAGRRFRLVLADPPYGSGLAAAAVEAVAAAAILDPEGLLAVEHHVREELPPAAGNLERVRVRAHGYTGLSLYRRQGG